jgi:hypothetical protein
MNQGSNKGLFAVYVGAICIIGLVLTVGSIGVNHLSPRIDSHGPVAKPGLDNGK